MASPRTVGAPRSSETPHPWASTELTDVNGLVVATAAPESVVDADSPRRLLVFEVLLGIVAVAVVAEQFWVWHLDGPPPWQPVSVLGLVSIPLLTRYSITVSRDAEANVIGLVAAVLFSSPFEDVSHIFPVWALLVVASSVIFKGGLVHGIPRATDDVVAGGALVLVAPHIDFGLRPFDRTFVGLLTFVAVVAAVFWVRRRLRGQSEPGRSLDARSLALALFGLYFASVFIATLRRTYTDPSDSNTAEVAVMGLGLVVATLIGYSMSQNLIRGVSVLSEAATGLPWPAEENDRFVISFARSAIRSATADIVPRSGPPGSLSAPIDAVRYLVLRRMPGDRPYTASDQRLLEAVASMASVSRAVDLREAGLRLRSITDAMTGLWNYPMFVDLASQAIRERASGEVLALLFLDLDKFKQLNEELGHFDADQVLREIATRLQDAAPPTSAVARFAGDEFALLLHGVDHETLASEIQALVEATTAPIAVAGRLVTVHISVGVGVSDAVDDSVEEVMRVAEENMREAKRAGRAASASRDERDMVSTMLGEGTTAVAFQPILDARTGALWGCEALLRATDPELGDVSPLTLVSSAARQQTLDELTAKIGAEALDAMDELGKRVSSPLHLTVNLEFEQFRVDNSVFERLSRSLGERGVQLVLELSERSYGRWTSQHDLLAARLKERGMGLAIDDFGAGYATFSLLNKWGWDVVKIDKSLITADDDQSRLVFGNVVRTLRELRLTTVAEGIETPEQLARARRAGVSLIQGHLVCEPVGMEELLRRVGPDGGGLAGRLEPQA
jgi:diguanylate cyclase (GGDEF)-like protein